MDIEKIVRDYLPQIEHLSLGTSRDNKPWVCEVHFAYDDNLNLYFRSTAERRHSQEIAENPNVAGNIVVQHERGQYPLGIYFEGTTRMLETEEEVRAALPAFEKVLGKDDSIVEDALKPEGHKIYKITVGSYYVFGNLDGQGGKKLELVWNGGKK